MSDHNFYGCKELRVRSRYGTAAGHFLELIIVGEKGPASVSIFTDDDGLGEAFIQLSGKINTVLAEIAKKRETGPKLTYHCDTSRPLSDRWSVIDSNTYDGAEDSANRAHIGYGATPEEAAKDWREKVEG